MCEGPMLRRTATLGDRGDRGENRGDEVGGGRGRAGVGNTAHLHTVVRPLDSPVAVRGY